MWILYLNTQQSDGVLWEINPLEQQRGQGRGVRAGTQVIVLVGKVAGVTVRQGDEVLCGVSCDDGVHVRSHVFSQQRHFTHTHTLTHAHTHTHTLIACRTTNTQRLQEGRSRLHSLRYHQHIFSNTLLKAHCVWTSAGLFTSLLSDFVIFTYEKADYYYQRNPATRWQRHHNIKY